MVAWCLGACVIIAFCLLTALVISGCQQGADESEHAGHDHDAAPDAAVEEEQDEEEEDSEDEPSPDLVDTTMTIAQFRARIEQSTSSDDTVELIGLSQRITKDKPGLSRVLIELLQTSADMDVRVATAEELGSGLVGDLVSEVVPALVRAADPTYEPEYEVRWAATITLMDYPTPEARGALKRALRDPVPEVQLMAARSFVKSFGREGPTGWVHLIDMLGEPKGDASALASLEVRQQGRAIVQPLLATLDESENPRQRSAIVACLGILCSGNTPIQERFAKQVKSQTRQAEIESTPDPRAVTPLIGALSDPSPMVREAAAQALGFIGDGRASVPLAKALEDESRHVRKRAASALMLLPRTDEAFAALTKAAVNDSSPDVRRYAVEALGWSGDMAAVDMLMHALNDEGSAEVRASAARYLGRLGDKKAVPALIARFHDDDDDVRWAAVRSIGQLGSMEAESALQELIIVGGQEAQVVHAAQKALRKMGGELPLSEEARKLFED